MGGYSYVLQGDFSHRTENAPQLMESIVTDHYIQDCTFEFKFAQSPELMTAPFFEKRVGADALKAFIKKMFVEYKLEPVNMEFDQNKQATGNSVTFRQVYSGWKVPKGTAPDQKEIAVDFKRKLTNTIVVILDANAKIISWTEHVDPSVTAEEMKKYNEMMASVAF